MIKCSREIDLLGEHSAIKLEMRHEIRSKQYCNQPAEDFRDAAVADLQYPGDVAWPGTRMRELDDLLPRRVRKWPAADEDTTQLVHPAVSCVQQKVVCTSAR